MAAAFVMTWMAGVICGIACMLARELEIKKKVRQGYRCPLCQEVHDA